MKMSLKNVMEKSKGADAVVIVGAGKRGKELLAHLKEDSSITVAAFFDNNEEMAGRIINDVKVMKPCKMEGGVNAFMLLLSIQKNIEKSFKTSYWLWE